MNRAATVMLLLLAATRLVAQNPTSDPLALSLAQKSVTAMTGGATISDVSLNAKVTFVLGSDTESGTGVLRARGVSKSRVDLTLDNGEIRSDVRNTARGTGAWQKTGGSPVAYAAHNCWTDAVWFYPALSSLTQTGNRNFVFKYLAQVTHAGVHTQHIQVFQLSTSRLLQHISTIDFYLDPASNLPLAITFQVHPDRDAGRDIAAEVRFASYQPVNGILVPFSVLEMLNGTAILNITVASAVFNIGLPDSTFNLQ